MVKLKLFNALKNVFWNHIVYVTGKGYFHINLRKFWEPFIFNAAIDFVSPIKLSLSKDILNLLSDKMLIPRFSPFIMERPKFIDETDEPISPGMVGIKAVNKIYVMCIHIDNISRCMISEHLVFEPNFIVNHSVFEYGSSTGTCEKDKTKLTNEWLQIC